MDDGREYLFIYMCGSQLHRVQILEGRKTEILKKAIKHWLNG